jgi:hypothetical protein
MCLVITNLFWLTLLFLSLNQSVLANTTVPESTLNKQEEVAKYCLSLTLLVRKGCARDE